MHSFDNDGYMVTPAYSTPSTGSLESIMDDSGTDSSAPSPKGTIANKNYFENIKSRFSGQEEPPERPHKIAYSYSFDIFGSGKLCGRDSPVRSFPGQENNCCGIFGLTIVATILFGIAELLVLVVAVCAIIHAFHHPTFWDISGSIIGIAFVHTLSFATFGYGTYKKRRKFLLPLIFQTILLLGAGCAAILIIVFTSFSDHPKSLTEQTEHKVFCIVLIFSVIYQMSCIIIAILLYRQLRIDHN